MDNGAQPAVQMEVEGGEDMRAFAEHLRQLESENAELRKQLDTVVAFIGPPNLLQGRGKRKLRPVHSKDGGQPSRQTSLRQASLRPATSTGVRQKAGAVTMLESNQDVPQFSVHKPVVVSLRPSTTMGTRNQFDNVRPQRTTPQNPNVRRNLGQRALSRSNTPGESSGSQSPKHEPPAQSRPRSRQALTSPVRPNSSFRGTQEEREEQHHSSQSWQAYRRVNQRPVTSLGTRIRCASTEPAWGPQTQSEPSSPQRAVTPSSLSSSQRLLRPATSGRLRIQKSEPIPPPTRWKSKTFNEKDFQMFLARQSEHSNAANRRSLDMEQMHRMQAAPLLPISSMVFRIDGGTYVESERKIKSKKMNLSSSLSSELSAPIVKDSSVKKRGRSAQTAPWRAFLGRQEELVQRQHSRCQSPDQMPRPRSRDRKPPAEGDAFERFFKRNLGYRQAREEYLDGLRAFYCLPEQSPRRQDPEFMVRHDPRAADMHFEAALDEARAKWRADHPLGPGQSPVLNSKTVRQADADEFWERSKAAPHVSNREKPTQKEPPEVGFTFTGNPYEGGKADRILEKLGPKSGIQLAAALP